VSATFVICVHDFPRGEVSVKVGVMEFGLYRSSSVQLMLLCAHLKSLFCTLYTGEAWLPNEINEGRLEWFLFLLAGVLLANLCLFVLIARRYTYNCLGAAIALPNSSSSYTNDLSTSHGASRPSLSSSGPLLLVPEPI